MEPGGEGLAGVAVMWTDDFDFDVDEMPFWFFRTRRRSKARKRMKKTVEMC